MYSFLYTDVLHLIYGHWLNMHQEQIMFPVILTIPIYQIRFEEIDAFKSGLKCVKDCCYWINK